VPIRGDTECDLLIEISCDFNDRSLELSWLAGKLAAVHALTAETAEPSWSDAQESSSGALGPTEGDHDPQTSYAMMAVAFHY
jgi:hypothetical protein